MTFPVLSANGPSGYNLTRSLRFRSSASAYLGRTPASAGNRQIWTWSAWVKRGVLSSTSVLLGSSGANYDEFRFSTDILRFFINGATTADLQTTAVYRDPSAWYHIVLAVDTTQSTASNRIKLYVNGAQVTSFTTATYPAQNTNCSINNNIAQSIGYSISNTAQYFDGYLAEVNFIDGQALTPSSFGSTNSTTGVWQPAKYTGTYGTNGFYLPFTNTTSTTTLGYDSSGNGNNWTPNNISLTAGSTYDSMTDVPTLTSATAANFAVLNPLNTGATLTNGNLTYSSPSTAPAPAYSAIGVTTGKWYYEYQLTATNCIVGVWGNGTLGMPTGAYPTYYWDIGASGAVALALEKTSGTATGTLGNLAASDIYGVALDCDNTTVYFYKNNTLVQTVTGMTFTGPLFFVCGSYSGAVAASGNATFGQRPFSYTPPSGFVALNAYNLPASTVPNGASYMAATTYTGTGASLTVANTVGSASFQPDLVWIKSRSAATDNKLTDSVRGVTKGLISNTTGAETTDTQGLTAFGSTGFTVGTNTDYNNLSATYVAWQWKGGGTAVSNTSGSITSTVSANTTSGFSIIGYTGTGVMSQTIGHGLGVSPNFVIFKNRTTGATDWNTYAPAISVFTRLKLNTTDADLGTYPITVSSTLITLPAINNVAFSSTGNNYIVYAWAAIKGFSAFGSYTGNGSTDGPFVYTGFRPRYVMAKRTDSTSNWIIYDSSRNTANPESLVLYADALYTEDTSIYVDFLSNGFKCRSSTAANVSGATYIYMAFAESPFQNSLAR